jgi:predicted nucleic acid-binding protein
MTVRVVLDTNVLLYALDSQPKHAAKRNRARELIASADWGLSTQIAQEFYVNLVKGKVGGVTTLQANDALESLFERRCIGMSVDLIREAVAIQQRYTISYWDAAVIASAIAIGAETLYSEDMNHTQIYDGVTVINPFVSI